MDRKNAHNNSKYGGVIKRPGNPISLRLKPGRVKVEKAVVQKLRALAEKARDVVAEALRGFFLPFAFALSRRRQG